MKRPDTSLARSIGAQALELPDVTATEITEGVMNWKFRLLTPDGDAFILRFYPEARASLVDFEPDLLRRCRRHRMRVPDVVVDSRSGPRADWSYVLYRMLPGRTLASRLEHIGDAQLRSLCRDIYAQMAALAELKFRGYGDPLTGATARDRIWSGFIRHTFDAALPNLARLDSLPRPVARDLEWIATRVDAIEPPGRAVAAWGDVSPHNIIVDDAHRLVGLIDFEGVLAAEMALNIGYLKAGMAGSRFCKCIEQQWRHDERLEDRANLYAVVRALRIMRYADKPLPLGRKRQPLEKFLPGFIPAVQKLCMMLR